MSSMVSMEVKGLSSLLAQLVELNKNDSDAGLGTKALSQAARKAFKPVVELAKQLVPKDSGALSDAIKISVTKPKGSDLVVAVGIKISGGKGDGKELPAARRWHWMELGTVHIAAKPYLRPALNQSASTVLDLLKSELVKSIAKAVKKQAKSS